MKIFPAACLASAFFFFSCNNSDVRPANPDGTKTGTAAPGTEPSAHCYAGFSGKDTVTVSLIRDADTVKANVTYRFFEKDKNIGMALFGTYGDTLRGEYTFISEGKVSIREISFLKQDSILVEGYGPMEEKNGKLVFSDPAQIRFTGFPLREIECGTYNKYSHLGPEKDSL